MERNYIMEEMADALRRSIRKMWENDKYLAEALEKHPYGQIRQVHRNGRNFTVFFFRADGTKYERRLRPETEAFLSAKLDERQLITQLMNDNLRCYGELRRACTALGIALPELQEEIAKRNKYDMAALNDNKRLLSVEGADGYRGFILAEENEWLDSLPLDRDRLDVPYYPEGLVFTAKSGLKVRSKSETMIADALNAAGLKYRYELPLRWGDFQVYPDFVIVHPLTGKIYIWEHLGKMDEPDSLAKYLRKIQSYREVGFKEARRKTCAGPHLP